MRTPLLKCLAVLGLSLFLGISAAAQEKVTVRGTVTDENNAPMTGVGVFEKGTSNGTVTDMDGRFSLPVRKGAAVEFNSLGYLPEERTATDGRPMDVRMRPDNLLLEETVVIGYGVQRKSDITGSISSVKQEDLQNRTVTNAQAALQGKTSGVQVINYSGAPGAAPAIRVRGYSSNSDMSPLYVVDGVRKSGISGLDPNDIESIEVLKDAASAAIYGAQAGNGVVLVTTKHGKKSDGHDGFITYDYQMASQSIANVPKLLNSEQYVEYMLDGNMFSSLTDVFARGWDGKTNTDWAAVTFVPSMQHKHNLSANGATDRGGYYVSLSYLDNDGIVKGDSDTYKRLTGVVNADFQVKSWLKVGLNTQFEKYETRSVAASGTYGNMMSSVLQLDPLTPDTVSPDALLPNMKTLLATGSTLLMNEDGMYYGISPYYDSESVHPMILRDRNVGKTTGHNVNGAAYLNFTPIAGLTATSRFGFNLSGSYSPSYSRRFYASGSSSNPYIGISATTSTGIYYQWENFVNYNRTFDGVHDLNAMAGMSFSDSNSYYTNGSYSGNEDVGDAVAVDDPYGFGDLSYGRSNATKGVGGGSSRATQTSYFGRVSYSYAGKYLIQASLRADAYDLSKLPVTNRWGYFPAVSAGWVASKEEFMSGTRSWLDNLKLRASWGQNGSVAPLGGYLYSTDMTSSGIYAFANGAPYNYVYGARPSTMGNDELSWETSEQTNLGLDAALLKGRLTFSGDWFIKKTKGLLVTGVTPSLIVGGAASPINAGNVENRGFEFELGWRDQAGEVRYGVTANLSTLKNEVTYLHPSLTRISGYSYSNNTISAFEKGHPVWYFYGYRYDGLDDTGTPVMKDVNKDGTINEDDKTEIGCAIPTGTYGITVNAAWKGFDMVVFGTGAYGNEIFMCLQRQDKLTSNRLKSVWYDNRWIQGADNSAATAPAAGANIDQYIYSDAMVFDGSYFKIKQIQLGYTIPRQVLQKVRAGNCRVYVSLEDFFTFTSYKGFDPEASAGTGSAQGIDVGAYPISKKVVAGVNISF